MPTEPNYLRRFASRLRKVEKLAMRAATQPQLANSSIEDGALQSMTDGTLNLIIGKQWDGTQSVTVVNGPTPPTPVAPSTTPTVGGAEIHWDGGWTNGDITPMNYGRVEVYVSVDPGFNPLTEGTLVGFFESPVGGSIYPSLVTNTYTVKMVAITQSGVRGTPSTGVTVTPTDLIDVIGDPGGHSVEPPTETPALTVIPGAQGFTLRVTDADPTVELSYYAVEKTDIVTDFTPGPTNRLLGPTRRNPLYVNSFTDGSKFDPTKVYLFKSVARRASTDAPPSDLVEAQIDPINDSQIASLAVNKLISGDLEAAIALLGSLRVGTNITIDPNSGIKIILANDGEITFPANGDDAVITAVARLRSAIIEDHLRILGQNGLVEGSLGMADGTTSPKIKPRAGISWEHAGANVQLKNASGNPVTYSGLYHGAHFDGTNYTVVSHFFGIAYTFNATTGAYVSASPTLPEGMNPLGGIVKVGSFWYVLGTPPDSFEWWVYKLDSSWNLVSKWRRATAAVGISITGNFTLGTDGTNLFTAYRNATGFVVVDRWNLDGTGGVVMFTSGTVNPTQNVTSLYVGNGDYGSLRYVVACGRTAHVFNSSGVHQSAETWTSALNTDIQAITYANSRFRSISPDGKVWAYSQVKSNTSRSITHSWYDNDPLPSTTHETEASPPMVYTQPSRQYLRVDTDPPADAGGADDPNAIRIYIDDQRQADLGTGVTMAVYDLPATGGSAAPTSNGFAGVSAPGRIFSTAADALGKIIEFFGSGRGRTGWNEWDDSGRLQATAGLRSTGSNQNITDSTWTKITLSGTPAFNEALTIASSEVTIDRDGLYDLNADVSWVNDSSTLRRVVAIEAYTGTDPGVGSGVALDRDERMPSTVGFIHGKPATTEWLTAGTKVRLIAWQNSGSTRAIQNTTTVSKLNVKICG